MEKLFHTITSLEKFGLACTKCPNIFDRDLTSFSNPLLALRARKAFHACFFTNLEGFVLDPFLFFLLETLKYVFLRSGN